MSETPISPLRQRMLEDMTVRKLGPATQKAYVRAVKALSEYLPHTFGIFDLFIVPSDLIAHFVSCY